MVLGNSNLRSGVVVLRYSGSSRKRVSVSGASHLRESKNTEFVYVWELSKTGFYEGGLK